LAEDTQVIAIICVLVWLINANHFSDEVFGGNVLKVRSST